MSNAKAKRIELGLGRSATAVATVLYVLAVAGAVAAQEDEPSADIDAPAAEEATTAPEQPRSESEERTAAPVPSTPPRDNLDVPGVEGALGAQTTPRLRLSGAADREAPRKPWQDEPAPGEPAPVSYTLESIEVRGNERTRRSVVLRYLPFKPGTHLDPSNPEIELARYRLLGTGFFRDVQFALEKGSRRGQVRLIVEVEERNTIVVNDVQMGLSADAESSGKPRPLTAYAGLDVAETNLGGAGVTLGSALALSEDQYALRVRYFDPSFLGSSWMVSASLLYNDATDFFGNSDVVWVSNYAELVRRFAIVQYTRFGGVAGVGRDLNPSTQLWGHYRLETLDAQLPGAAAHTRGGVLEPIVYDILPGHSILSTLRATLQHDTRDHPLLPTQGWFATATAELGIPGASDYEFQRFDAAARSWWALPWYHHVLGVSAFAGVIDGFAPFFEQHYIGDFSDFLPGRMLGLRFDRRPPPDFLKTAVREVRYGHYAFQLNGEYRVPLYRGQRAVFGIDLFGSVGIWGLAHRRDLSSPPRGYSGASLMPVDLTGNVGFRMDTTAGGLVFAFSNVLGFIPVRGDEGP